MDPHAGIEMTNDNLMLVNFQLCGSMTTPLPITRARDANSPDLEMSCMMSLDFHLKMIHEPNKIRFADAQATISNSPEIHRCLTSFRWPNQQSVVPHSQGRRRLIQSTRLFSSEQKTVSFGARMNKHNVTDRVPSQILVPNSLRSQNPVILSN
jgi:hypothetical protein